MNIIEWRDALLESPLNYKAKFIGLVLSQFYRHKHATYPSIRTLSQLSGLTVNPVQEGIAQLISSGFIIRNQERISGNRFISNLYVFVNVEQNEHVSPRDTSFDTSFDTSPRDTEVEEIDKVDKVVIKKKNNIIKPDNISQQIWNDFKRQRKNPITETALNGIIKQADIAGYTLEQALQECCIRGWQSFKAEWVNKPSAKPKRNERETIHLESL